MASDEVLGLLDQVLKHFAVMQFRKRSFEDVQCQQMLKRIAALCHTHPFPPPPLFPPGVLGGLLTALTQWPCCWHHKKIFALSHLTTQ